MNKMLPLIGIMLILLFPQLKAFAQPGITWTSRTTPATSQTWNGIAYGNGLFVAVASTGTGNRVMTSPDGINWTSQTTLVDNNWTDVTYGDSLFVAVSSTGTGDRVMTSPDGINWTIRASAADNSWGEVVYGNGLFVATAGSGTGNRVMTSPDGINWTIRTSAADNLWNGLTYGNGLFVAVAGSGNGNRVMTSPDGITWTSQSSAANLGWSSVAYGAGLYVAVSAGLSGSQVMTSPDGITWTAQTAVGSQWQDVVYAGGLFVAVSRSGTGNRVMTSPDGINWTLRATPADINWSAITYGAGSFVAVSNTGTGNQVMTSDPIPLSLQWLNVSAQLNSSGQARISWQVEEHSVSGYTLEKSSDMVSFETVAIIEGYGNGQHNYSFTEPVALSGKVYYRIKQIDNDGSHSYSRILHLSSNNESRTNIYPNPTKNIVTVNVSNDLLGKTAIITDIYGRALQNRKITSLNFTVNIQSYPAGIYFIIIDKEKIRKIIKE